MTDAQLIEHHGGPARLAEKLGWSKAGSVQRINNWKTRGVPAAVKLKFPAIFLPTDWRNSGSAQTEVVNG